MLEAVSSEEVRVCDVSNKFEFPATMQANETPKQSQLKYDTKCASLTGALGRARL